MKSIFGSRLRGVDFIWAVSVFFLLLIDCDCWEFFSLEGIEVLCRLLTGYGWVFFRFNGVLVGYFLVFCFFSVFFELFDFITWILDDLDFYSTSTWFWIFSIDLRSDIYSMMICWLNIFSKRLKSNCKAKQITRISRRNTRVIICWRKWLNVVGRRWRYTCSLIHLTLDLKQFLKTYLIIIY